MPDTPFYLEDAWLNPYYGILEGWHKAYINRREELCNGGSLLSFASGHLYYGTHVEGKNIVFREWAPGASDIYLVGDFNDWKKSSGYRFNRLNSQGDWELSVAASNVEAGSYYKLSISWEGGEGLRIPAYAGFVKQDSETGLFSAVIHKKADKYKWRNPGIDCSDRAPMVYEAHIGMSSEEEKVSTFNEFRVEVLPRIAESGYNTLQLMAIQEHPYYGSFGYHVSNFFAVSSRFGTPDEFRQLVDEAHGLGLAVTMDIVHSHAVKNINEGLGLQSGDPGQYFHKGDRRLHPAWDSLCFDYGRPEVIHFLLSNCRYWLEEFNIDGFRFDGVTSMLYFDHGLSRNFTDYGMYFDGNQDIDAIIYLKLANELIQDIRPGAITVAEELNIGAPDLWIKGLKEKGDEEWNPEELFREMSNHRVEEKTITYCESHDQALVGDKTIMFRLADAEMYTSMHKNSPSLVIDRAVALHKMIRLFTLGTGQSGYLNFMGNEFGHPEWIDFPRKDNGWSYRYARRQWSLAKNEELRYSYLDQFDRDMTDFAATHRIFEGKEPELVYSSPGDKVIAFRRRDLLFVFNFHPTSSYTDYALPVAGRFRILLNSDNSRYGGFGRIDESVLYLSQRRYGAPLSEPLRLSLYLPARTAAVFINEPLKPINQSIHLSR